jgi:hypothetical protein
VLSQPGHPDNGDGNLSWSDAPKVQFVCNDSQAVGPPGTYCMPSPAACRTTGTPGTPRPRWCGVDVPLNGSGPNRTLADAATVADATAKLRFAAKNLAATGQPFFVGEQQGQRSAQLTTPAQLTKTPRSDRFGQASDCRSRTSIS